MNLATETMLKIREQLGDFEKQVEQYATEPYGVRKSTAKEQRQMYENLTEGQLYEMIEKHGLDDVNKWLYKMEQGGK